MSNDRTIARTILAAILAALSAFGMPVGVMPSTGNAVHVRAASPGGCIVAPCESTVNIPFDSPGSPCPEAWGTCGARQVAIQFDAVPASYSVKILRVFGDLIGWARGPVPPGAHAGMLWGLYTSQVADSPNVEYGSEGCPIYLQGIVGIPRPFDERIEAGGILPADNLLISQEAFFLNETGQAIHIEATFNLVYQFGKGN